MAADPRLVLVIIGDAAAQQAAMAFDGAGLQVEMVTATEVAAAGAAKRPALIWMAGELGSPAVGALLEASSPTSVALLCAQAADALLVRQCRRSVVELFVAPFSARVHPARVSQLLEELPKRAGQIKLRAAGRELRALLEHLGRARRTGTLTVTGASKDAAEGTLRRGQLERFQWGPMHGAEAMGTLATIRTPMQITFEEDAGVDPGEVLELERGHTAHLPPPLESSRPTLELEPSGLELAVPPPVRGSGPGPRPRHPSAPAAPPLASPRRSQTAPRSSPSGAMLDALDDLQALTSPLPSPGGPRSEFELVGREELPQLEEEPPAAPPGALAAVDPQAIEDPLLLVDDDETLLAMMATFFSKRGYPVATAVDGLQALEKLAGARFSLVIADLSMPRLDGWGFLRRVREDARFAETPIALFSAQDDFRERLRAHHAGAQGYFQKAIKLQALDPQVRELLEPRRRFRRLLALGQSVSFDFSALGPQWVLRTLAGSHFTGAVEAAEAFSTYDLRFSLGHLDTARVRHGVNALEGPSALQRFLATRSASGTLSFTSPELSNHFEDGDTELAIAQAVHHLNDERQKVRDLALKGAKGLEVDHRLFELYVANGPSVWQPIVRMLCEERVAPREVLTRLQVTPQELTQVVHDLLRRGVVALKV